MAELFGRKKRKQPVAPMAPMAESKPLADASLDHPDEAGSEIDYAGIVGVLLAEGRGAEAVDVMTQAFEALPQSIVVALSLGEVATGQQNWTKAITAYERVRILSPDHVAGHLYGGWALWAAGRQDEADTLLSAGVVQFPAEAWMAIHYAMSARSRPDWPEAVKRFAYVRTKFPDHPAGFIEGGWALREAGNLAEADVVLSEAVKRFPNEESGWLHYGRNASVRGDWNEAVRRWEACRAHFPTAAFWERHLKQARYELDFANSGANGDVVASSDELGQSNAARDLMLGFESIGNNCEFGFLQRDFGAEPLGLLRFGEVPSFDFLMRSLLEEFEGVGEPENTRGDIGFAGEHVIYSSKGFRLMHTHVYESTNKPLEQTVKEMLPRLKYLRRRLIETLTTGSKILVYKQWPDVTDEQVRQLHEAVSTYGDNRLLCVRQPSETHKAGEVYRFSDRVVIGHVPFPEFLSPGVPPDAKNWLSVCTQAKAMLGEQVMDTPVLDESSRLAKRRSMMSAIQQREPAEVWRLYRETFEANPLRLLDLARSLRTAGAHDDSKGVLLHLQKLLPDNIDVALMLGEAATRDHDWSTACEIYARVRAISPENAPAQIFGGWALWEARRFEEADELLARAVDHFPDNPWALIHYAMSARSRADWPKAAERYGRLRELFPDYSTGFIEGGWALREAGRPAEADPVLAEAVRRFPKERSGWLHYGRNATVLADWKEAVRRWEACRAQFPDSDFGQLQLSQALYERDFDLISDSASSASIHELSQPQPSSLSDRDLMLMFESIGNNCEFGITQRSFGAEPLGLLRFGEVPTFEFLMQSLQDKFEGVGEPQNTRGDIGFAGEHVIYSTKGFRMMHTYVYGSANRPLEQTVKEMLPRLRYLRRRLIETLTDGSKILVYKRWPDVKDEQIQQLHGALSAYGDNRLLCVRQPSEAHKAGEVYRFSDRVVIGHVPFPEYLSPGVPSDMKSWLSVCMQARAILGDPPVA